MADESAWMGAYDGAEGARNPTQVDCRVQTVQTCTDVSICAQPCAELLSFVNPPLTLLLTETCVEHVARNPLAWRRSDVDPTCVAQIRRLAEINVGNGRVVNK